MDGETFATNGAATPEDLHHLGVVDLLEHDRRAAFITDLESSDNHTIRLVFSNSSLQADPALVSEINGHGQNFEGWAQFRDWALEREGRRTSKRHPGPTYMFYDILWSRITLKNRWRVICANEDVLSRHNTNEGSWRAVGNIGDSTKDDFSEEFAIRGRPSSLYSRDGPRSLSKKSTSSQNTSYQESAFLEFFRTRDWASTAVGSMGKWPRKLREMTDLIMRDSRPVALYWGPDYTVIYNEAYSVLTGSKHPRLMGMRVQDGWPEASDVLIATMESCRKSGLASVDSEWQLFLERLDGGRPEETYFSWSVTPIFDGDHCPGFLNPVFETTMHRIGERRIAMLNHLGEIMAQAKDVTSFWGKTKEGLETASGAEADVPFSMLYSVIEEDAPGASNATGNPIYSSQSRSFHLENTLGVPEGHKSAPIRVDLDGEEGVLTPYFRKAVQLTGPLYLQIADGSLPRDLFDGFQCRGFGDPVVACVICPIRPTKAKDEEVMGLLVLGLNPRRPYNAYYRQFLSLLCQKLTTTLAASVLFEEEARRGRNAAEQAAFDRAWLLEQLAIRTKEFDESSRRFQAVAEVVPAGLFFGTPDGHISYANNMWYDITGHVQGPMQHMGFLDCIVDEDRHIAIEAWRQLVSTGNPSSYEFRIKSALKGSRLESRVDLKMGDDFTDHPKWILATCSTDKAEDESIKMVIACWTDISQFKWAESVEKQRTKEALDSKRQQENFIDMTSHEIRNPLANVILCSQEIIATFTELYEQDGDLPERVIEAIHSTLDAAQTITLCAQHQKRMVDDILTLSKLDSTLLLVTPVDCQPEAVVHRVMKMFENEIQANDIRIDFFINDSYKELEVEWVRLDPSRLLQVLINLTTNAIKFTQMQEKRQITIRLGASIDRPTKPSPPSTVVAQSESVTTLVPTSSLTYFPSKFDRQDITAGEDWGNGRELYLHFDVQDTGRGLTEEEKKLLFLRFSQASPRTHVQYGGSGLGLFISRELTELQGGEIGVASEAGIGSTFSFYVKARQAPAPALVMKSNSISSGKGARNNSSTSTSSGSSQTKPSKLSQTKKGRKPAPIKQIGRHVLIVEDNLVNQRVLSRQLRNAGCVVSVANQGQEALNFLQQTRFWHGNPDGKALSVVLMDLEMPVMDGLTCVRAIRDLQAEGKIVGHVPVIAVTANARSEQIDLAMDAGMDSVVTKPFQIPVLMDMIEGLVAVD